MGYISDVTMLFYATDSHEFPLFKLWFDENVLPVMNEHWGENAYELEEFGGSERGYAKGYALRFDGVKWYDSRPEVQAIEEAWDKFQVTFNNEESASFGAERARIGEDYSDVEYDRTYHSMTLLDIVRRAEIG